MPSTEVLTTSSLALPLMVSPGCNHMACEMNGETVLLNLQNNIYFSVSGVGRDIWDLINKGLSPEEILDALVEDYDVDRAVCREDVKKFIDDLAAHGLVEVS